MFPHCQSSGEKCVRCKSFEHAQECMMRKREKCYLFAFCALLCTIKGSTGQEVEAPAHNNNTDTVADLEETLLDFEIIPDFLEDAPSQVIKVQFGDKVVHLGNKLRLLDIMVPPNSVSWDFEKGALYTLILAGPDYPCKIQHQYRQYPHWVIGNIPGNSYLAGETVIDYRDPPKTYLPGIHRFVFTLYKQNGSEPVKFEENLPHKRNSTLIWRYFRTEDFVRKYKMKAPVGVNFFEVDL